MAIKSFRVVPSGLAVLCLAVTILTGCGGSGAKQPAAQVVSGPGFSFAAPADWQPALGKRRASASHGDELVQVATFPLLKPYSDALFAKVDVELRTRMKQLAAQTGGTVSGSATVKADGIRSHSYDVTATDHVDEYTFVLRGMREYQLLCRRKASSGDGACRQLITTFRVV
jgi:hypothetical protein